MYAVNFAERQSTRWLVLFIVGVSLLIAGCEPPRDTEVAASKTAYSFDPRASQAALAAGRPINFQFEWQRDLGPLARDTRPPEFFARPTPMLGQPSVRWSEADFAGLVQRFIEHEQKRLAGPASLYNIVFKTSCQQAEAGPQAMIFYFFSRVTAASGPRYFDQSVYVDAQVGRLDWLEAELVEVTAEPPPLRRDGGYRPAEEALRSAEDAGGRAFRSINGNQCNILGILNPKPDWEVSYATEGVRPSARFEVRIDRRTGQAQVLNTPEP